MAAPPVAKRPHPVRDLNDAFRRSFSGGRVVLTPGIAALPEVTRAAMLAAVSGFDAFDADNDPHGEQDFGAVEVAGRRCFWKIDTYDRDLRFASSHPADPAVTARVLTVMQAEEYGGGRRSGHRRPADGGCTRLSNRC
ncbi:DUF3768 domain-containing protein [Methylorubrum extorquens]|uniref:DUF3768 domain-containing protein n=1 Tax=Methylorubrum extorquens TaxID=408 RepID=UPI000158FAB5|nr:DUF3768 domain-containing protein [Methylorubrum extorquens]ABY28686.1 hypothetical protein Mext_0262 [Methylorubrum extorquens PA1]KQP85776.1 hypothetical protein ASF55_15655 [Methylobacterium sp. Leaf119]WIU40066.1 DUF3768 domain-containing protein [Methylorubrum extorquens]